MANYRTAIQSVLGDDNTFSTTLLVILIDNYGTDALTWAPETPILELASDFNVKLPAIAMDRLLAAVNLLVTDDFYQSLPDFVNYCNILSGSSYDPRIFDPADSQEIAWGITEAMLIAPPDDMDQNPFSEEITGYIAEVLRQEGIITPPTILSFAVDRSQSHSALTDFQEDPGMLSSIYGVEANKTAAIENGVKQNLMELSAQLQRTPLRHGNNHITLDNILSVISREHKQITNITEEREGFL